MTEDQIRKARYRKELDVKTVNDAIMCLRNCCTSSSSWSSLQKRRYCGKGTVFVKEKKIRMSEELDVEVTIDPRRKTGFQSPAVGGPHRGRGTKSRSASPSTARHSHLWGARSPRVLRSSTSNLDDPCDSGGTHGRSAPNPPYGASSGWWVIFPWRLGEVQESLAHGPPGGMQAQSL